MDAAFYFALTIVALMFLAAPLGFLEWLAITRFNRAVFHLGPIVLRQQRYLPPIHDQFLDGVYETPTGSFTFTSSAECLFRTRYSPLFPGFRTYPQLKGVVTWQGHQAFVVARAPLAVALFQAGWFSLLLLFAGVIAISGEDVFLGLGILAIAALFGFLLVSTTLDRERRYLCEVLDDLQAALDMPAV